MQSIHFHLSASPVWGGDLVSFLFGGHSLMTLNLYNHNNSTLCLHL